MYMAILNQRYPHHYFLDPLLYTKLVPVKETRPATLRSATGGQYNYENVKKWTSRYVIQHTQISFFPYFGLLLLFFSLLCVPRFLFRCFEKYDIIPVHTKKKRESTSLLWIKYLSQLILRMHTGPWRC